MGKEAKDVEPATAEGTFNSGRARRCTCWHLFHGRNLVQEKSYYRRIARLVVPGSDERASWTLYMLYKGFCCAWTRCEAASGVWSMPSPAVSCDFVPILVHFRSRPNLYKTFPTNCSSIFRTSLLNTSTSFQQFSACRSCSLRHETTSCLALDTSFGKSVSTFLSPSAFCSFSISSCTFLLLAFFFAFSSFVSDLKRSFGVIEGSSSRPGARSDSLSLDVSFSSDAVTFWRAFSRREEFSFVNFSSSAATLCWM